MSIGVWDGMIMQTLDVSCKPWTFHCYSQESHHHDIKFEDIHAVMPFGMMIIESNGFGFFYRNPLQFPANVWTLNLNFVPLLSIS